MFKVKTLYKSILSRSRSDWPAENMYKSDYMMDPRGRTFNWTTFKDMPFDEYLANSDSHIRKQLSVFDKLKNDEQSCSTWNGKNSAVFDVESEKSYRSQLFLMLPSDLYEKYKHHSYWSSKVCSKNTPELNDQSKATFLRR